MQHLRLKRHFAFVSYPVIPLPNLLYVPANTIFHVLIRKIVDFEIKLNLKQLSDKKLAKPAINPWQLPDKSSFLMSYPKSSIPRGGLHVDFMPNYLDSQVKVVPSSINPNLTRSGKDNFLCFIRVLTLSQSFGKS